MDSGVRACVFDAYGTLFDVHSAAEREAGRLGIDLAPLSALWRQKQLEYSWLRSLMGRHVDFAQVTADALDFALEAQRISEPGLRKRLLGLYDRLEPYSEARPCLQRLRERGLTTAILSNGSPAMLAAAVEAARLGALLDEVLSIEDVGAFKPTPDVYGLAVERLKLPQETLLFVSANGWDVAGAAAFGLRVAWLNRSGAPRERLGIEPDLIIRNLAELEEFLEPQGHRL